MDPNFARQHRGIVQSETVELSFDVALAEYMQYLTREPDPLAAYWRGVGAQQFVKLFRNLVEEASLPKASEGINLPSMEPGAPPKK